LGNTSTNKRRFANRFWIALFLASCRRASAAEVIPLSPGQYFSDYAKIVPRAVASQLNQMLEDFERHSPDQIVVAVLPRRQSESSVED
jgi:uncharacterized protein